MVSLVFGILPALAVSGDGCGQAAPLHTNECHDLFAVWIVGASVAVSKAKNDAARTIEKVRPEITLVSRQETKQFGSLTNLNANKAIE